MRSMSVLAFALRCFFVLTPAAVASRLSLLRRQGLFLTLALIFVAIASYSIPAFADNVFATSNPTAFSEQQLKIWNACERAMLGQTFLYDPFETRLIRLENAVFGQAQGGDPFPRAHNLMSLLVKSQPDTIGRAARSTTNRSTARPGVMPVRKVIPTSQAMPETYHAITGMEDYVFHRSFEQEDIHTRLNRLEAKTFGRAYSDLTLVDRMDNLRDRYPAVTGRRYAFHDESGSTHYQSASRSGFSPVGKAQAPRQQSLPSGHSPNIMIGGGFSSMSRTQFSPEMMNMLPPDIRAQMQGSSSQNMARSVGMRQGVATQSMSRQQSIPATAPITSAAQAPAATGFLDVPLSP